MENEDVFPKYHKIQGLYKRDPKTKKFIEGEFSTPELYYLQDNLWIFTEKMDGTNLRIRHKDNEVEVRGRTDRAQLPMDLVGNTLGLFNKDILKEKYGDTTVTFFGEGYGGKIQSPMGMNYSPDGKKRFILFDINIGGVWLKQDIVTGMAIGLGIDRVPIVGAGTLQDGVDLVRRGFKSTFGDFLAEGIVCRPAIELRARVTGRIICKIKACDWEG